MQNIQLTEEEIEEQKLKRHNSVLVVELSEYIEQLLTERPDRRKKQLYQEWSKEINELAAKCNKLAKYKIYDVLK